MDRKKRREQERKAKKAEKARKTRTRTESRKVPKARPPRDPFVGGEEMFDLATRIADGINLMSDDLAESPLKDRLDATPDNLSRLELPDGGCDPVLIPWPPGSASSTSPTNGEDRVYMPPDCIASWIRAKRDGFPSLHILIHANLCGHRLFYLGGYDGDTGKLPDVHSYFVDSYARQVRDRGDYDGLIVMGDGSRRWLFSGSPQSGLEMQWWHVVSLLLGCASALWVVTVQCAEIDPAGGGLSCLVSTCALPGLLRGRVDLYARSSSGNPRRLNDGPSVSWDALFQMLCGTSRALSCNPIVSGHPQPNLDSLTSESVTERNAERFRHAYSDVTTHHACTFVSQIVPMNPALEVRLIRDQLAQS